MKQNSIFSQVSSQVWSQVWSQMENNIKQINQIIT